MMTTNNLGSEISAEARTNVYEYGWCVPLNVTSVRVHPSVTEIDVAAFHNRTQLRKVELNDGLHLIGKNAFNGCKSLASITFPSTLVEVDNSAFRDCQSLREVTLNDGLQKIGDVDAIVHFGVALFIMVDGCRSLSSITLPSFVTVIGNFTFCGCTNLRKVVLTDDIQKIGRYAFLDCPSLERFTIPGILARTYALIQTRHWAEEIESKLDELDI